MYSINDLKIYYQNVQGLRTKTSTLFKNVLSYDFDIICLSESWLLDGIFSSECFDARYSVYRSDRDYLTRGDSYGGGTLIAVRRELPVSAFSCIPFQNSYAEAIEVVIDLNRYTKLRIYCCYLPHGKDHLAMEDYFFDLVSNNLLCNCDDFFLVAGDFNITQGQWDISGSLPKLVNSHNDSFAAVLGNFLSFTGFFQFNHVSNKNGKFLDLIIGNCMGKLVKSPDPLLPENMHHPALEFLLTDLKCNIILPAPRTVFLFQSADQEAVNKSLNDINWYSSLNAGDIEVAIKSFYVVCLLCYN